MANSVGHIPENPSPVPAPNFDDFRGLSPQKSPKFWLLFAYKTNYFKAIDVIIVLLEILACLTIKATSGWFHEIKGNFPKELKALVYKEYNDTPCLFNRFLRIS